MRSLYAAALYKDPGATLDNLREAATTLEEIEPTARRVLSGAHPVTVDIERALRVSQAKLDAREADEAERLAALEAVARTAPPQPPPAMSRREQLFARPLTGRSRLDNMVAAGLVEEDDEDAWAADLEEELFS